MYTLFKCIVGERTRDPAFFVERINELVSVDSQHAYYSINSFLEIPPDDHHEWEDAKMHIEAITHDQLSFYTDGLLKISRPENLA